MIQRSACWHVIKAALWGFSITAMITVISAIATIIVAR